MTAAAASLIEQCDSRSIKPRVRSAQIAFASGCSLRLQRQSQGSSSGEGISTSCQEAMAGASR